MISSHYPLTADELAHCERVGTRLQTELAILVDSLPPEARSVREMASHLRIDRNLCQRIAAAARERSDANAVLLRVPGARGMDKFVRAYRRRGGAEAVAASAIAAIRAFAHLVQELGGSQTRLNERLRSSGGEALEPITDEFAEQMRRKRFEADMQLKGIGLQHGVVLDAMRPMPSDPDKIEHAFVAGHTGIQTLFDGLPYVNFMSLDTRVDVPTSVFTLDGKPLAEDTTGVMLKEFCSSPVPEVTTRASEHGTLLVFDSALRPGGDPIDVFHGRLITPAGDHPKLDEHPVIERSVTPRYPTRQLIVDTYLHRSLASASVPTVSIFNKTLSSLPKRERWYDRLPNPPSLEVSGPGLSPDKSACHPRQEELTRFLFEKIGWPAEEFFRYRIQVEFPLCGAEYLLSFDFEKFEDESS